MDKADPPSTSLPSSTVVKAHRANTTGKGRRRSESGQTQTIPASSSITKATDARRPTITTITSVPAIRKSGRKQRAPLVTCGRTKCVECARKREARAKEEMKNVSNDAKRETGDETDEGKMRDDRRKEETGCLAERAVAWRDEKPQEAGGASSKWGEGGVDNQTDSILPHQKSEKPTEPKIPAVSREAFCLKPNEKVALSVDVTDISSGDANHQSVSNRVCVDCAVPASEGVPGAQGFVYQGQVQGGKIISARKASAADAITDLSLVKGDVNNPRDEPLMGVKEAMLVTGLGVARPGDSEAEMTTDTATERKTILAWLPSPSNAAQEERGGKPDSLEWRAKRLLAEAEWEKVVTSAKNAMTLSNHTLLGEEKDKLLRTWSLRVPSALVHPSGAGKRAEAHRIRQTITDRCLLNLRRHPGVATLFVAVPSAAYKDTECFMDKQTLKKELPLTRVDGGIFKYLSFAVRAMREFLSDHQESELRIVISSWKASEDENSSSLSFPDGQYLTATKIAELLDFAFGSSTVFLVLNGNVDLDLKPSIEKLNADNSSRGGPNIVLT